MTAPGNASLNSGLSYSLSRRNSKQRILSSKPDLPDQMLVLGIKPVLNFVPLHGFLWLLGGGLFYTVGVFFFASKRISYSHAIWHVFVLCGSVCHYWAVLRFPREPGTYSAHRTRMRASKLRPFPTSRPCSLCWRATRNAAALQSPRWINSATLIAKSWLSDS
jgi:hypothetical protein